MIAPSRMLALLVAVLFVFGWAPKQSVHDVDEHVSQIDCVDPAPCRRTFKPVDSDPNRDAAQPELFGSRPTLDSPAAASLERWASQSAPSRPSTEPRSAHRPRGPPLTPSSNLRG